MSENHNKEVVNKIIINKKIILYLLGIKTFT